MSDSSGNNVIISTRFSRLARLQASQGASAAEIQYEALAALAEALDLLATALQSMPSGPALDAGRIYALQQRLRYLELLVRTESAAADGSDQLSGETY